MKTKNGVILAACLALTVFSGVLKGRLDYRWGVSDEFVAAAELVNSTPTTLGNWQAAGLQKLDDQAKKMLRCTGDIFGVYKNNAGEQVTMTFLVGPAGPLAVHTAEVCYGSSNFTLQGNVTRETIVDDDGNEHRFAVAVFEENRAGNRPLKVYYAWNDGDGWDAPDTPRTAFTGTPMLYKLQIATRSLGETDAAVKFLKQNLPKLEQHCVLRAKP